MAANSTAASPQEEKNPNGSKVTQSTDSENGDGPDIFWSEQEERALVRKIDWLILPILIFGFSTLQLNRSNIAFSLNNGFLRDVGITQNQFNIGQQLLSAGIVIFEMPSNIILYRVGPTLWIGFQILAWSLVGIFQSFQKGLGAFLATRLLLGICESGFIPAGLYTMTKWYKTYETGKRFSIYFAGSMGASALGGLIAFGVMKDLQGRGGMSGWQWLFIIEGLLAFVSGVIFIIAFPKSPSDPVSILGFRYFNEREQQILVQRVRLDDHTKANKERNSVSWEDLRRVLTNWRLLPHVITTIAAISPAQGLGSYAPSLVAGMGFTSLSANAMMTVPAWITLVGNLSCGWISDKLRLRGPVVLVALACNLAFTIANRLLIYSNDRVTRFSILAVGNLFATTWHPLHGSWLAMNCISEAERSVTMAIHIMGANIAGIVGAQIFRSDDSPPFYPRGWSVILALIATAVAATIISNAQYLLLNRYGKRPEGFKWKV